MGGWRSGECGGGQTKTAKEPDIITIRFPLWSGAGLSLILEILNKRL